MATNILAVSGRAMLDALVAGTTDPEVLSELARGKLRAKLPALREALEGRFEPHHALVIGAIRPPGRGAVDHGRALGAVKLGHHVILEAAAA